MKTMAVDGDRDEHRTLISLWYRQRVRPSLERLARARAVVVWPLALIAGVATGYAILAFRFGIGVVQSLWLGVAEENIVATKAGFTHPLIVFAAPVIGGLVVGLMLIRLAPKRRAEGVADVIETAHLRRGRIDWRSGLAGALITTVSLGAGASAGREGPAVHIGATLAGLATRWLKMPLASRRALLAAGAAAAVAASFNAPIAGVIFAHEVILGHYALTAFVPAVLAAVAATIVTRVHLGDYPAFILPDFAIASLWEMPAFALLGVVSGLVAALFLFCAALAEKGAQRMVVPLWLRPLLGGVVIGAMAAFLPQILGVGYEATNLALRGRYDFGFLLLLLAAKMIATAVTLASRFGGGVFSPSLFLGAMTGAAFGVVAAGLAPEGASAQGTYALIGTGAVAGAVLGAPLSTALIVFEMTGDYKMTLALLMATALASVTAQVLAAKSFFHWQLAGRGLDLEEGPHKRILHTVRVRDFMEPREKGASTEVPEPYDERPQLARDDTLRKVLRALDEGNYMKLAVVDANGRLGGWVTRTAAMEAYNRELVATSVEEHR